MKFIWIPVEVSHCVSSPASHTQGEGRWSRGGINIFTSPQCVKVNCPEIDLWHQDVHCWMSGWLSAVENETEYTFYVKYFIDWWLCSLCPALCYNCYYVSSSPLYLYFSSCFITTRSLHRDTPTLSVLSALLWREKQISVFCWSTDILCVRVRVIDENI